MPWALVRRMKEQLLSMLTTSLDGYDVVSFSPGRFKSLGSRQGLLVGHFVKMNISYPCLGSKYDCSILQPVAWLHRPHYTGYPAQAFKFYVLLCQAA